MQLLALDAFGELSTFVVDYLPVFLGVAFLIVLMMWVLARASRYVEYLKMLESHWVDNETLDYAYKFLAVVWVGILTIAIFWLLSFRIVEVKPGLAAFIKRMPALFIVIFVLLIATIIVRMLHRFAQYLRGELKTKPRRLAPSRALAFTELFMKYLIYAIAGVIAFLGGIGALPPEDQQYKDLIFSYIQVPPPAIVLGFVVAIIAIFVIARFVDSVFEDLKRRSTKFTSRTLEEMKSTTKYAVYVSGAAIILIIVVDLILSAEQLLVFIVAVILVVLVGTFIAFDTIRNGLAGVTLMLADRFSVGDHVKIEDKPECTVEAMGLLTTQMRNINGDSVSYPNSRLLRNSIINISRSRSGTIVVEFTIDFSVPNQNVRGAILEAVGKTAGVETNPSPQILSTDIKGSSLQYRLIAHTRDVFRSEEIRSDLIFNLQDSFRRVGLNPTALQT